MQDGGDLSEKKQADVLRELAQRYMEVCAKPEQNERRRLWALKNSLKPVRPLIYVRAFAWREMPQSACVCADPLFRGLENQLRQALFVDTFNDDTILEPWVTLKATHRNEGWGLAGERRYADGEDAGAGAYKEDYPIRDLSDIEKLRVPCHEIDEEASARDLARAEEAIGDIVPVNLNRGPARGLWAMDISTDLGHLRGIEHVMMDMLDHPEWLHRLVAFMRDGILKDHAETEAAGDFGLANHYNQAMPYAQELEPPAANARGVRRSQLWGYMAAQEFTGVSPDMHEEFLLRYQMPIMEPYGLVAYGCCEDLTHKIDRLRQIPNLRRIAVSPFADVARCAEQIGTDYVVSYRPSPADMVSYRFDPDRVRSIVRRDLEACRGCHVDITLKDVETVEGDPERVRTWTRLVRELVDSME